LILSVGRDDRIAEQQTQQIVDITADVTTNHVAAPPDETTLEKPTSNLQGLVASVSDGQSHDISSFLSRPFIVKDYAWGVGNSAGTELFQVQLPQDLLINNVALAQKVNGFLGLRCDVVLRFQVNSNRFQQGRLMVTWYPGSANDDKHVTLNQGAGSLMMKSQLPRSEFDIAKDTEVVMRIPYVSQYLAYNLTTGFGPFGHVGCTVYGALQSVASGDTVEITCWASMENVELLHATKSNPGIVTQSDSRIKKLDKSSKEQRATGPISSHIDRVRRIADIMTEVPLLSSVAGPVGWFASIAANAAQQLGFSNPISIDRLTQVTQKIGDKAINVNGQDNSHNLGLTEDNQLEILPGASGNDTDEMSLNYLFSLYSYWKTIQWTTSQIPYTVVSTMKISPQEFTTTEPINGGVYTCPLSYFTDKFRFYRGGIKFKFKLVKTEFHSGRIAAVFLPGYNYDSVDLPSFNNASDMTYLHKEIFDIRDANEFEFVVPYANTRPWNDCQEYTGYLQLIVINTLRAPATVSQTIDILVEVAGAEDFEVAVPTNTTNIPYLITQADATVRKLPKIREDTNTSSLHPTETTFGIGITKVIRDSSALANRYCTGEVVLSLRQLLKRHNNWLLYTSANAASSIVNNFLYPWFFGIPTYSISGAAYKGNLSTTQFAGMVDYMSAFAICYNYYRGGMRLRYRVVGGGPSCDFSLVPWIPPQSYGASGNDKSLSGFTNTTYKSFATGVSQFTAPIPVIGTVYPYGEVNVPYQSMTHMSRVINWRGDANIIPGTYLESHSYVREPDDGPKVRVRLQRFAAGGTGSADFVVTRQAADDFNLHFFTGTPPMKVVPLVSMQGY